MGLLAGKDFSGSEILQICVIGDDVDWSSTAFQVLAPMFESLSSLLSPTYSDRNPLGFRAVRSEC